MVININDVAPQTGVFDGVERRIEKKALIGKTFEIVGYSSELKGADGDFNVLLCKDEKGMFTTTANEILMKRVRKVASAIGVKEESQSDEHYLNESVQVTLTEIKSATSGRNYFAFE